METITSLKLVQKLLDDLDLLYDSSTLVQDNKPALPFIENLVSNLNLADLYEDEYKRMAHQLPSVQQILDSPLQKVEKTGSVKQQMKNQLVSKIKERSQVDVEFQEFTKMTIQVGQIIEVEKHPVASELYVLQVNIGNLTLQLCAALVRFYEIPQLLKKKVLVLTNLKRGKKMQGVESHAMLLAASFNENLQLLILPDSFELGASLFLENVPHKPVKEVGQTTLSKCLPHLQIQNQILCFKSLPLFSIQNDIPISCFFDIPDFYKIIC